MANLKDSMGQDLGAKIPVLSSTTIMQNIPFTQAREKPVSRQLDDSFADLQTWSEKNSESPSTSFLMSEIQ